jgi:hypothetical protein
VYYKYKTKNPNVLCCPTIGTPFRKGVVWAMQAAMISIHWKLGSGEKVRFWEDQWLGNTSLVIYTGPCMSLMNNKAKL